MVRIKKFLVRLLCCLIPVRNWRHKVRSYFAIPLGVRYLDEQKFFEYINGKTVAVVGNGPQQIGKRTGNEIDSADIVVRFNTFELDGYTDDYGCRTDVWVNGCGGNYDDKRYLKTAKKCKFVIWRCVYEQAKTIKSIKKFFAKCFFRFIRIKVMRQDSIFPIETMPVFCGRVPTLGCVFLWYLKTYTKPKEIRIYGFSFMDKTIAEDELNKMKHFYNKCEVGGPHDMSKEVVFLRDLINNQKVISHE